MTSSPWGFEWLLLGSKVSSFDPYFEGWGRLKQQVKHGANFVKTPLAGRWCRLEPHHSQPRYSFWSMLESCQRSAGWGSSIFCCCFKCWMFDRIFRRKIPSCENLVSEATDRAHRIGQHRTVLLAATLLKPLWLQLLGRHSDPRVIQMMWN